MYWMDHGMGGWGAALMLLNFVLLTAVAVGTAVLIFRPSGRRQDPDRASAGRILAERYARGEIDDEEYQRRLSMLALN